MSGIIPNIMSFFRPGQTQEQAAATQQPAPTQQGQQQTPPTPGMAPVIPAADPSAAPVDPMDKFKDIWTPAKPVEGAPKEFNPGAIFDMNPESIAKAVGGINFAEGITADQLQAISAGGEDAVKVFAQVLNSSSAKAMTLSTNAAAKMIEKAMTDATGAMDGRINKQVKLNQVNQQMQELNPALSSPAAAPLVQALTTQFTQQFPTASPAEIAASVKEYMAGFANLAAGKPAAVEESVKNGSDGMDWEKYMG